MNVEIVNEIKQGFETAYIDGTVVSNLEYKPSVLAH